MSPTWCFILCMMIGHAVKPAVRRQTKGESRVALLEQLAQIEQELHELHANGDEDLGNDGDLAHYVHDEDNGKSNQSEANGLRLADPFATLVSDKLGKLCAETAEEASKWVADAKHEAMAEIMGDCLSEVGLGRLCGLRGKKCAAGQCVVGEGNNSCKCMAQDDLEQGLDSGAVQLADVKLKIFSESGWERTKYNLASKAHQFVANLCESTHFQANVDKFALKFEEEFCIAINSIWLEYHADNADERVEQLSNSTTLLTGQLEALREILGTVETRANERLDSVSQGVARAMTDALKFIFAPAEVIPYVGDALHTMLMAMTDYVGHEMEANLRRYFAKTVNEILHAVYQMAEKAVTKIVSSLGASVESAVESFETKDPVRFEQVMEQLKFVFSCTGLAEHVEVIGQLASQMQHSIEETFKPIYLADTVAESPDAEAPSEVTGLMAEDDSK